LTDLFVFYVKIKGLFSGGTSSVDPSAVIPTTTGTWNWGLLKWMAYLILNIYSLCLLFIWNVFIS